MKALNIVSTESELCPIILSFGDETSLNCNDSNLICPPFSLYNISQVFELCLNSENLFRFSIHIKIIYFTMLTNHQSVIVCVDNSSSLKFPNTLIVNCVDANLSEALNRLINICEFDLNKVPNFLFCSIRRDFYRSKNITCFLLDQYSEVKFALSSALSHVFNSDFRSSTVQCCIEDYSLSTFTDVEFIFLKQHDFLNHSFFRFHGVVISSIKVFDQKFKFCHFVKVKKEDEYYIINVLHNIELVGHNSFQTFLLYDLSTLDIKSVRNIKSNFPNESFSCNLNLKSYFFYSL